MKTVFDLDDEAPKPKWCWPGRPPQVYILSGAAILFGPVALFASTQMAALLLIVGSLVLLCNPVSGLGLIRRMNFLIPFGLFLILGALSSLWAVEGAEVAKRFWRLLGFGAFAVLIIGHARDMAAEDRHFLGKATCLGFCVFLGLFLIERVSGSALMQMVSDRSGDVLHAILNRPSTLLLLLVWPFAGYLFANGKWFLSLLLFGATFVLSLGLAGQVATVALSLGLLAACSSALLPRVTAFLGAGLIGIAFLVLPILMNQGKIVSAIGIATPQNSSSLAHRLIIWNFTAEKIAERPVLGWGLDASRLIPESQTLAISHATEQGFSWVQKRNFSAYLGNSVSLPLHPHSLILQSWLELGFFGAASIASFLILILFKCISGPPSMRACRVGFFVSAFTIASVSYGAWQSWWLAALAFTVCFLTAIPPSPKPPRQWPETGPKQD